jgi:hypothetical protein
VHIGQQRLQDDLKTSPLLKTYDAARWLHAISDTERDIDTIFSLIAPELHKSATDAMNEIKSQMDPHPNIDSWPCAFSGIGVIVNRISLPHRDPGGCPEWYDFLVGAGTYRKAYLEVKDFEAKFQYNPGTGIAICGKLLKHSVMGWEGGERICYAHYMRNNVLNRLGIEKSGWVKQDVYFEHMSENFLRRSK